MEEQVILALVLAIPIIVVPVALVWYLNMGGLAQAVRRARKARMVAEKKAVK